jgi:hypothetical protein
MSEVTIKARINAGHPDMEDVRHVAVFGCDLLRDYAEFTVSEAVAAKMRANPTIEVEGSADPFDHDSDGRAGGSLPRKRKAPEPAAED